MPLDPSYTYRDSDGYGAICTALLNFPRIGRGIATTLPLMLFLTIYREIHDEPVR